MKRSLTERMARKFPWHRKDLLRKARIRRYIRVLERRSNELAISLRDFNIDATRGAVWEIAALSMLIANLEESIR